MRLWWLLIFVFLSGAVSAESWGSASQRLLAQGQQLPLDESWRGQMIRQDLQGLLAALQSFSQWKGEGPMDRPTLHETRQSLQRGCARLRVSLGPHAWLEEVQALARSLESLEKAFGGHYLPSAQAFLASPLERDWTLPEFEDPRDLGREARSLRLDLQSLTTPRVLNGALGYGGGWPGGIELQQCLQAASQYESICTSDYLDVAQTERAYRRLAESYDRLMSLGRWNFSNPRRTEREMERLQRFYKALEESQQN